MCNDTYILVIFIFLSTTLIFLIGTCFTFTIKSNEATILILKRKSPLSQYILDTYYLFLSFITVLLLIFNICKYKTLKITFSIGNIRQNTNHAKNVNKESKELNGMRGQLQLAIPRRAFFRSHAAVSYPLSGVLHRDTQIS